MLVCVWLIGTLPPSSSRALTAVWPPLCLWGAGGEPPQPALEHLAARFLHSPFRAMEEVQNAVARTLEAKGVLARIRVCCSWLLGAPASQPVGR